MILSIICQRPTGGTETTMNDTGKIIICEPDFAALLKPGAELCLLAGGFQFLEGPTWYPCRNGLVFSDIPADTMYLWTAADGVKPFRVPSHHANGNTLDEQNRLVTCEHGSRRVTRTEDDGRITVLADRYQDKRLNSPNDITVQRDGTVWFSDPPYGIRPEEQEQPACFVFRRDLDGTLTAVADDFIKPNGLCFSPDEKILYVSDTANERHHIRRFAVQPDKSLKGGEVFAVIAPGKSDGFRVDAAGRIWTSSGEGIWCLSPAGRLLGKILVPEIPSNCAFGGDDGQTLFITARTGLYAICISFPVTKLGIMASE